MTQALFKKNYGHLKVSLFPNTYHETLEATIYILSVTGQCVVFKIKITNIDNILIIYRLFRYL